MAMRFQYEPISSDRSASPAPMHSVRALLALLKAVLVQMALPLMARLVLFKLHAGRDADLASMSNVIAVLYLGVFQDVAVSFEVLLLISLIWALTTSTRIRLVSSLAGVSLQCVPLMMEIGAQYVGVPGLSIGTLVNAWNNVGILLSSFVSVLFTFSALFAIAMFLPLLLLFNRRLYLTLMGSSLFKANVRVSTIAIIAASVMLSFVTALVVLDSSVYVLHPSQSVLRSAVNPLFQLQCEVLQVDVASQVGAAKATSESMLRWHHARTAGHVFAEAGGNREVFEKGPDANSSSLLRKTQHYQGAQRFQLNLKDGEQKPNILVLTMESWRHATVGSLGASRIYGFNVSATPRFDELAKDGILFDAHFTPATQTDRTLLTNLFGLLSRFAEWNSLELIGDKLKLLGLPQLLSNLGYATTFLSGTSMTWHNWQTFLANNGFDQVLGEQECADRFKASNDNKEPERTSWGLHDEATVDVIESEVERMVAEGKPYFLQYYSLSSHDPHSIPESHKSPDLSQMTDGRPSGNPTQYPYSIEYSDFHIGRLIDNLKAKGLFTNTIVIIQGDHGKGIYNRIGGHAGDNSYMNYCLLEDAVNRVPFLILPSPDLMEEQYRGMFVEDVSSSMDLMATLADMIDARDFWQEGIGTSLMREFPDRRVLLEVPFNTRKHFGVRDRKRKYVFGVDSDIAEVYDTEADPKELQAIWESKSFSKETDVSPDVIQAADFAQIIRAEYADFWQSKDDMYQ